MSGLWRRDDVLLVCCERSEAGDSRHQDVFGGVSFSGVRVCSLGTSRFHQTRGGRYIGIVDS